MSVEVIAISERAVAINLAEATPKKVLLIAQQTLNAGAKRGKTRLVQLVRSSLNLPAAYVRERADVKIASSGRLVASLVARKRDVQLLRYAAKPVFAGRNKNGTRKRAGLTVKVKAGGATERLPGAFFVTLKGGNDGIAIREPRRGKYVTGNQRFEVLYGPSINQSLKLFRPTIVGELQQFVEGEIKRRIALLSSGKAGGSNAAA